MTEETSSRRMAAWASAILLAAPAVSLATVVDVAFDAQGRFEHSATIAPGKFIEVCGKIPNGSRVAWNFEAQGALDFNIHYHVGEKVEYPEKRQAISQLAGTLEAPSAQDYCWMWKSSAQSPVSMKVQLRQQAPR